ncbi:hypothetical protein [Streptomyces sp. NPDC127036]|uniref:hypothetical protein n=1 Tax=unclassified Streptomyces TaxID=2593676 RepID=UPI003653A3B0
MDDEYFCHIRLPRPVNTAERLSKRDAAMTTLEVTLLGGSRKVSVVRLPSVTSARDGRALRHFSLELHVPRERHEALEAELRSAAAPDGQSLRGEGSAWHVRDGWTVVAHGQRPGIYIYRVEIQEEDAPELDPGV